MHVVCNSFSLFSGFIIVTDAIPAMGLPIGKHHIGSQLVEIMGKKAVIAGTNTLCGRYLKEFVHKF